MSDHHQPKRQPQIGDGVRMWHTRPGWSFVHEYLQDEMAEAESFARMGQAQIPRLFTLAWVETNPEAPDDALFAIHLLYEVVDSQIELRLVLSWPMEVPEALAFMRREGHSLESSKRHALMSLFADDAEVKIRLTEKLEGPLSTEEKTQWVGDAIRSAHETPVARRRNRITRAHLAEVAQVYRTAWQAGRPPTEAVKVHFATSHSTAARWVGLARKEQLLGEAAGARGGEKSPDEDEGEGQ